MYKRQPIKVQMKVTYTEPGMKGDTATNTLKPATVESGATVPVSYTHLHAKHDSQIPNFNTLTVSQQNAKPTYCSIISYTFKCNIHFTIGILSFNLQPFCRCV